MTGTGEWGHCSVGCPQERQPSNPATSTSSSSSSSFSSSSSGQTSSAFTVEGTGCKTRTGVSGTCRYSQLVSWGIKRLLICCRVTLLCVESQLNMKRDRVRLKLKTDEKRCITCFLFRIPSLCVGTSLDFIEKNPCSLPAGEEVPIS